jgi:hypothetical protein
MVSIYVFRCSKNKTKINLLEDFILKDFKREMSVKGKKNGKALNFTIF